MNGYLHEHLVAIITLFASLMHILGILSSVHALMSHRTSQGAIAWAMSLIMLNIKKPNTKK